MSLSSHSSSSDRSSGGEPHQAQHPKYFAYRHAPGEDLNDGRKAGTISVENGAINLHIPCAFSYAYDVPVPKPKEKTQHNSASSTNKHQVRKPKRSPVPKESQPFCATVKSGQLYHAKNIPTHASAKTHNKTSVVWDFHAGERIPFQAVDYGRELYEEAARNLARTLREQSLAESKSSTKTADDEDDCFDYSKPGINFSRNTTRALERAMESLQHLPTEMEQLLRKDQRFDPIVMSKATKSLNVPRNKTVFKDLIPVDPNPDVRTEAEKNIQAEVKRSMEAIRQPSRTKDLEPKLEDFQTNSYTRIRPAPVQTPPKPESGIGLHISHDFDTIERERQFEDESNRM